MISHEELLKNKWKIRRHRDIAIEWAIKEAFIYDNLKEANVYCNLAERYNRLFRLACFAELREFDQSINWGD